MKKSAGLIIAALTLISIMCASTVPAFAFDIDPRFQVDGINVSSLSAAFAKVADNGSVIRQVGGKDLCYLAAENIIVTTDVTLITGKVFGNTYRRIEFSGNDQPLFTVKNGGKLTLQNSEIRICDSDIVGNGKLIVVEMGGTLVLDGTEAEPVIFSDSAEGLIWVKNGGTVIFNDAIFGGDLGDGNIKVEDGGSIIYDLNGDRVINGIDLCYLRRYLDSPWDFPLPVFPDINRDGNVNLTDVSLLLKYLAERAPDPEAVDISDKETYTVTATPDKSALLRFTPKKNAKYTFVLPASEKTKLWYILYDENGNLIGHDFFSSYNEWQNPDNGVFEITYDFNTDTEYYLEIGPAGDDEICFDINVPVAGTNDVGSVISEGDIRIIITAAVIAVIVCAAFVIVKKKKENANG